MHRNGDESASATLFAWMSSVVFMLSCAHKKWFTRATEKTFAFTTRQKTVRCASREHPKKNCEEISDRERIQPLEPTKRADFWGQSGEKETKTWWPIFAIFFLKCIARRKSAQGGGESYKQMHKFPTPRLLVKVPQVHSTVLETD